MSSASFRERDTVSTCNGAMAFRVPNSSSVPAFIGPPGVAEREGCPRRQGLTVSHTRRIARKLFAAIAAFESSFSAASIFLRDAVSWANGIAGSRNPPPHCPGFGEGNGLLGRPATCTNSKFQRTPRPLSRLNTQCAFPCAGKGPVRWAPLRRRRGPQIATRQDGL